MKQSIKNKATVYFSLMTVLLPSIIQTVEVFAQEIDEPSIQQATELTTDSAETEEAIALEIENSTEHVEVNQESSDVLLTEDEKSGKSMNEEVETENKKEEKSLSEDSLSDFSFTFSGTDGNSIATVTGYTGSETDIEIPSEVVNKEAGWETPSPVEIIGNSAFFAKGLNSVYIPSSVVVISEVAFFRNNLTNVDIPDSVMSIGHAAFEYNNITNLVIPNSTTNIASNAFASNNLTSVKISSNIAHIGHAAFAGNNLINVNIPDSIESIGNMVFHTNPLLYIETSVENIENLTAMLTTDVLEGITERTILRALDYKKGTKSELVVASGTDVNFEVSQQYLLDSTTNRVWEEYTPDVQWYKDNESLENATASSLKIENAQLQDSGIYFAEVEGVRFSDLNLEVIGGFEFTFSGTDGDSTATLVGYTGSATDIEIPSETINTAEGWTTPSPVTIIDRDVFDDKGLTSVVIPNSVTSIGMGAFIRNELTSVKLPNSMTTIEEGAFAYNNLINVEIPDSVTTIGPGSFMENKLTSVDIPNSVIDIEMSAFAHNNLTSVDIPDSVTTIELSAFAANNLTSIGLSKNLNSIGISTFTGNPLKFINTSSDSVEDLRGLLTNLVLAGLTSDAVILRALDYEVGTEQERTSTIGQSIDYAIAQQYSMPSQGTRVWRGYTPTLQWYKNETPIESTSANQAVLLLTQIQESDSGMYFVVADGERFSDLSLNVIPELEPDIPAIDPHEPNVIPEETNPNIEGLSLRYVSDFDFGSTGFSAAEQELSLVEQDQPRMVTVQDMRPRDDRSGWELLVRQETDFMNGAQIIMHPYIHEENQNNYQISATSQLILGADAQRFAGTTTTGQPNPAGIVSMGVEREDAGMKLKIPSRADVGKHSTTLNWELVMGP